MRTTKLFAAVLAAGLLFSGCRQDEDYVLPDIKIGTESLEYAEQTAGQSLDVTATRDWMVRSKPDWIAVDPERGSASSSPQSVTITVLDNAGYNRSGEVLFSIGLAKAVVKVTQAGAKGEKSLGHGTLEDPYTVEGAVAYVSSLPADTQTTENIYIKGVIGTIGEPFGSYGNATFYIKDKEGDASFYVYRTLYLGNKKWTSKDPQIQEGDEVTICGLVVNYKGNTPETVINKSYIYMLNGETQGSGGGGGTPAGTGTLDDPYNAAGANAYVNTLADNAKSDADVYIKGKISKIANNGEFGSYGNASFYISDDGETGGEDFYCYRVLYLGNREWKSGDTQIKVGDDVIICGKVTKYVSSYGTTPETVQKEAFIYSLNGTTEGGGNGGGGGGGTVTPSGSGTQADPYNVAAAREAVANLTWTSNDDYQTTEDVYVKGKISKIADKGTFGESGTYGNASFYMKDEGGDAEFYAFRILYLGNKKYESGTDIKVGDEVVICGKLMNYRGNTPETVAGKAYLYSLNNTTDGGSGNGGGDNGGGDNGGGNDNAGASGNGTLDSPYNAAGAAAAVANLTWTANDNYQTTDEVYVKGKISKIADKGTFGESGDYGNASFYISDDGKTEGTQFYIFRTLYLGNVKYTSGTDIKVGDEVIIKGPLMNYKGNTPETVGNKSYLYSLNGKTE